MDRTTELSIIRRAFAKQVLAEVQVDDPVIEAAFATVPREDFLGPGPWVIPRWLAGLEHSPLRMKHILRGRGSWRIHLA
jgi:protein-L-isoaspartate(D-aspartate) O-methyltransferase